MPPIPRRVAGVRLDHGLLLAGCLLMTVGSVMPWIEGSTRVNGNIRWTGLDDTGEGTMLIAAALAVAGWVRWRSMLEEIDPRARFIPLLVVVACGFLWGIAFQKALYLSWFELAVGARPQLGMFVAAVGIIVAFGGAVVAATDPDSVAAARAAAERERRGSGAGGPGAASSRVRRGGGPPSPDGYSVVGRVERLSGRPGDEAGADRDRG